ncbi:MAG: capsular polysaccharide biosynthesis protein, partial [Oscillospiraceae bacterium]|nr:capsular polysaccharide biosynthesis protein [Oscillospiraceae bacterium]
MIDFHSHILPGMDDGSGSVSQSLAMLRMYATQNVGTVMATPHFYREAETVESFLKRRGAALLQLQGEIADGIGFPQIVPAAEVNFFHGISRSEDIDQLCMGDSRCMLLELPFEKWESRILGEIRALSSLRGITTILA